MIWKAGVVVVWTVCTLVASYGCRCGSLHNNNNDQQPQQQPTEVSSTQFYPDASSSDAGSGSSSRQGQIDSIKTEILGRLGLERVPQVDRMALNWTEEDRRRTVELYERSVEQLSGKTHRIITEDGPQPRAKQFYSFTPINRDRDLAASSASRHHFHIRFNVNLPTPEDTTKELVVKSATLRLYRKRVRRRKSKQQQQKHQQRLRINVYQRLPQLNSDDADRKRLVDSRLLDVDDVTPANRTWLDFDVLKAARDWTRDSTTNLGLIVSADVEDGSRIIRPRLSSFLVLPPAAAGGRNSTEPRRSPTLNVLTRLRSARGAARRRARRSADSSTAEERTDCERGDGETRCCRYPIWVSFAEIGWNQWIVAPAGYRAYYCDGACPPRHRVAHHFAGIKTLVNGARPDAAPSPCCTATRMSPLTLAHYDRDGRTVVSVFDDMIVEECMCT